MRLPKPLERTLWRLLQLCSFSPTQKSFVRLLWPCPSPGLTILVTSLEWCGFMMETYPTSNKSITSFLVPLLSRFCSFSFFLIPYSYSVVTGFCITQTHQCSLGSTESSRSWMSILCSLQEGDPLLDWSDPTRSLRSVSRLSMLSVMPASIF